MQRKLYFMKNFDILQKKVIEITMLDNFTEALNLIVDNYVKVKFSYLTSENIRFETKWKMNFYEFEKNWQNIPNSTSYEVEKEYYEWEGIVTEMEHFKKFC